MTAYSMTISNSVRAFGGGPPSLWNAHLWNAFKWGEGTVKIPMTFVHLVTAANLGFGSARYFRLTKLVDAGSIGPTDTVNFNLARGISNSLGFASDSVHQYVFDASGYYRVFPGGTTDGETRVDSAWTDGSSSAPSWTQGTASSTSWSAA